MDSTRVLVVDDHDIFIEMAKCVLEASGYVVRTASDACQALEVIPTFQPHLILMDIQMPVMDGFELTRQLKADAATQKIVIVAFTAFAIKGDETLLKDAGFDGYVGKPLNVMTLAAELRFWLEAPAGARASRFVWP